MMEPVPPNEPHRRGLPRLVWLIGAAVIAIAIWAGLILLVRSIL